MSVSRGWSVHRLLLLPPASRREVLKARFLHRDHDLQKKEEEKQEGGREMPGVWEYRVQYNPSAYHRLHPDSAVLVGTHADEELTSGTFVSPFRQRNNPYTVRSSRHLSSAKNTLLDLAFNRGDRSKVAEQPTDGVRLPPDVRGDPRAFQRCRPEYRTMSHDLSLSPPSITIDKAFEILHDVTELKGSLRSADIVRFLSELGHVAPEQQPLIHSDTRFSMLLRYSVESLRLFSHAQLLEVLRAFVWLNIPATHSILTLYEAEFSCRVEDMEFRQLLLTADLWRCLVRQVPRYLELVYTCAARVLDQLELAELVQLLYVIGEGRRCPPALLPPLELLLLKHLNLLLPEEVGTVSLAFFKSQSSLSAWTARRLADQAHHLVEELSDYALVNVLKLLRFNHLDHRGLLWALRCEIPRRAPRMGIQGLMHVALTCSSLHYRNDDILLAVAQCLPPLAPLCRSKDAGKLLWAFGMLGFPPSEVPQLYPCLTQAMRLKEVELQHFPQHLLTGLLGLAFLGLYPQDLLKLALSEDFVRLATGSQHLDLKKDLFTLDSSVGLEIPNWKGPRISPALTEQIQQQLWTFAQQDVCLKAEVLEAEELLQELLGGEAFVHKRMILPHTRSIDLELRLDSEGCPIPLHSEPKGNAKSVKRASSRPPFWEGDHTGVMITEDLLAQLTSLRSLGRPHNEMPLHSKPCRVQLKKEQEDDERMFTSGVTLTSGFLEALRSPARHPVSLRVSNGGTAQFIAVQVSTRNHFCYQSQQLLGLQVLKRRQLALVGYRVVDLPPWEWLPLLRQSRTEKLAYLQGKIFSMQGG
ncbi:FAST kinase domain-containing protein 5, mitochondrial [Paramormyrops kingsleyae]|uniref:FAST kinase domain-containing protein 5, mitochondrial n=1 Tax=Paramormyrops kingsleyae TaxID=1676925 RepID=UPI003B97826A